MKPEFIRENQPQRLAHIVIGTLAIVAGTLCGVLAFLQMR